MKKTILLLSTLLLYTQLATAQGEQNIWIFGDKGGLDFNGSATYPVPYSNNLFPGYDGSASICNASGQLLFYTNGFWVWNRDHQLMPELTAGVSGYTTPIATGVGYPALLPWTGGFATQSAAIAGVPGHPGQYYLFSLGSIGQLFYSIIDMSLNAGKGGIVSGKKAIQLGTNLTGKLTVVNGCNNIWLMTRSKIANQYKAYEINDTGIVTTPVISNCGNLPLSWYLSGVIKFSKDGSKMAASCNAGVPANAGGLELYDFNIHSGTLSNAQVLDSSSTLGYYYGACFSPDNTKLYATTSSFAYANVFYSGKLQQFDVSLGSTAAIIASNTIAFSDVYSLDPDRLGDLKRGFDNKIYFVSGHSTPMIHVINNPNNLGIACNAIPNVVTLTNGYAERGLPNDIAIINPPDTLNLTKTVTACFRDTILLTADSGKRYQWQDGATNRSRTVFANSTYVVHFINLSCQYETDSIKVRFIPLPVLSPVSYSCPQNKQGIAWLTPKANDTTTLHYTWKDESGTILQQHSSNQGDTLKGIDTGIHFVQITTPSGCDTNLLFTILALPVPTASFTADSIACKGAPVLFTNTGDTTDITKWYFGDGNFSTQLRPTYYYGQTGDYTASFVVTNIEGCSDTAQKEIHIKGLDLRLTSDKDRVNYGELIALHASGDQPFTVTAWEPKFLFAEQSLIDQTITMDTTRTFRVKGISEYGCTSEASVAVTVNPAVFMPNAFTPNGDGQNDRFCPVSSGYIFVRYFNIFNRYGEMVYTASGKDALKGWDGTYKGQLEDLGVYYYQINIETEGGGTISFKGDVTLLR